MKKVYLIIVICILFFSLSFKNSVVNDFPLVQKLVILDPGHGNFDPGSIYKDEYEKDFNLDFAVSLKKKLENLGATVILTREGDYDLSSPGVRFKKRSDFNNRIKLINDSKCDLFVSLHMNYLDDSSYFGSQVFYTKANENNKILADTLQKKLNKYFDFDKETRELDDSKYMFNKLKPTGVLIEYGFISNYRDRTNLKKESYRSELSKTICEGIIDYFTKNSQKHNNNYS